MLAREFSRHVGIAVEHVSQSTYTTVTHPVAVVQFVQYFQAFDGFGNLFGLSFHRIHCGNEIRVQTQLGTSMVQGNDLIGYGIHFGGATGCFQVAYGL